MGSDQRHNQSPVIGLTGSIGTGKSAAASDLESLGAKIIDADVLAREVVAPGTPGLAQIRKTFGDAFIDHSGSLKRKALGTLVFSDPAAKSKLEDILHPLIRSRYLSLLAQAQKQSPPLIVYVVPLLFESRFAYPELDAIVVVSASAENSLARIIARDACSREDAERRLRSQLPIAQKTAKADFVLQNDGTREELRAQVVKLFNKFTKQAV